MRGPLLCCVAVLSRVKHKPRYARLLNFLFYTFPDTIECLRAPKAFEGSNHGASHMWHPSALGCHGFPPAAGAESRNHHQYHSRCNSSARPPQIVHRSPSWRVCDVAFARYVFAGRFGVSVAAGRRILVGCDPDPDVDMTRRAVPIAPDRVCLSCKSVFVLRCVSCTGNPTCRYCDARLAGMLFLLSCST